MAQFGVLGNPNNFEHNMTRSPADSERGGVKDSVYRVVKFQPILVEDPLLVEKQKELLGKMIGKISGDETSDYSMNRVSWWLTSVSAGSTDLYNMDYSHQIAKNFGFSAKVFEVLYRNIVLSIFFQDINSRPYIKLSDERKRKMNELELYYDKGEISQDYFERQVLNLYSECFPQ